MQKYKIMHDTDGMHHISQKFIKFVSASYLERTLCKYREFSAYCFPKGLISYITCIFFTIYSTFRFSDDNVRFIQKIFDKFAPPFCGIGLMH